VARSVILGGRDRLSRISLLRLRPQARKTE
jgi:hypothetical protein